MLYKLINKDIKNAIDNFYNYLSQNYPIENFKTTHSTYAKLTIEEEIFKYDELNEKVRALLRQSFYRLLRKNHDIKVELKDYLQSVINDINKKYNCNLFINATIYKAIDDLLETIEKTINKLVFEFINHPLFQNEDEKYYE